MPWAKNRVPTYGKHRASRQAIVCISGRDHYFYFGPYGTMPSRLEYDRLISEWLASGRSNLFDSDRHDITIVERIADYLRQLKETEVLQWLSATRS